MTVRELKECFSEFNLSTKLPYSDDYVVSDIDIRNGSVFQRFISGDSIIKIVSGLDIINDEIYYVYPVLNSIYIDTNDEFPPCGGEQELIVYAKYIIRKRDTKGADSEYAAEDICVINALITLDNDLFTYDGNKLINSLTNNTGENIYVTISATYFFNTIKYNTEKKVVQHLNFNSPWLVESEPTNFITVSFSDNNLSNKGGFATVKVERSFTRIYQMIDSCGHKIAEKTETDLVEDITNKSFLTNSNKKAFTLTSTIVSVSAQLVGAPSRETTITARYLDKEASSVLRQNEGPKLTHTYVLLFDGGTKTKFLDLETSIPTTSLVPLISRESDYLDGQFIDGHTTSKLKAESDSEWVNASFVDTMDGVNLIVKATEANTDKDNDREAVITITNTEDTSLFIKLIVSQPALDVVDENYVCTFHTDGEYTTSEINDNEFYFEPHKYLIYEDGSSEETEMDEGLTTKYDYVSENNSMFNVRSIDKVGSKYVVRFNNFSKNSMKDISFNMVLSFYKDGKKLFDSDKAGIIVKGNVIIDYNYELCFEDHNKFTEELWDNVNEPRLIKINSLKHKLVNGIYAGAENTPYRIGIYNDKGEEYFDDTFSVRGMSDEILVFPVKTDKDVKKTYTVTQLGTKDKIQFSLTYKKKKKQLTVPLKVVVYSNNVGCDIWTGENGYLLIDGKNKIRLNPCWLSPTMKDKVDIAYNGKLTIPEGEHIFETFNVVSMNYKDKTHKPCNIKDKIIIDENTKNVILSIKI